MQKKKPILSIHDLGVTIHGKRILSEIDFVMHEKEHWAITGRSGSGKSVLARALTGRTFYQGRIEMPGIPPDRIVMIEQQHHYKNNSNTREFYYQQRFNSSEAENTATVREALLGFTGNASLDPGSIRLVEQLHLEHRLDTPLIQLSNGENKRLQLAEALVSKPQMLIADNPFIGLDTEGRETLHRVFDNLARSGIHLLIITDPEEIPDTITHVLLLNKGEQIFAGPKNKFHKDLYEQGQRFDPDVLEGFEKPAESWFEFAVRMEGVHVRYGDLDALYGIDWEVRRGSCWSISGPNGAGKSTLLSLITGDHPQAYANRIWLFDRRRGTGESIWDIKKQIGYVSPEMHLHFEGSGSCFQVVASGLFDTIGLFRTVSDEDITRVTRWMQVLQLEPVGSRPFIQLSLGEQRLVLLARALVKNPPVLVLDEPCQGLDHSQICFFNSLIDALAENFGTTVLYVTHYSQQLPACITEHLRLENGMKL